MVARKQYIRNLLPHEFRRSGVLRILKQIVIKCLYLSTVLIVQHTWNKSGYSIHDSHGWKFSASQHKIAYGHIVIDYHIKDPLIYSLVMATQKNYVLLLRELLCNTLIEGSSLRSHIYDPWFSAKLLHQCRVCIIHRLRLHDHACTSPIWVIIHMIVFILGVISYIYSFYMKFSRLYGPSRDTR